jgi:hypothetical protein
MGMQVRLWTARILGELDVEIFECIFHTHIGGSSLLPPCQSSGDLKVIRFRFPQQHNFNCACRSAPFFSWVGSRYKDRHVATKKGGGINHDMEHFLSLNKAKNKILRKKLVAAHLML